ncbi:aminoglycoside phosphotransferase family protein [Paenibacillaceae bacterium]|nr:aminoglycoside phosphotransferase family protein [Paenibacillaceae bacterium]
MFVWCKACGTQENLHLQKLSDQFMLGKIIGVPEPLSGGLMHRMYGLQTTAGKYAVKALNPEIMRRPAAMQNFITSERIAALAAKSIPALPAKTIHGTAVQEIAGQFYLLFDWLDGRSLKPDEINVVHCRKLGAVLSNLHRTDFSELAISPPCQVEVRLTDWHDYVRRGQENNAEWVNLLLAIIDKLQDWNALGNDAAQRLASDRVISHGDLDSKNVMWHQDQPILIDWESAGFRNPMQDLIETAVYWSEHESGNIDKARFIAFIDGYREGSGRLQANWRVVLENGFSGKLDWLEYNLKRALWMECTDEAEQQLGTAQVIGTIHALERYADQIAEFEQWLAEMAS